MKNMQSDSWVGQKQADFKTGNAWVFWILCVGYLLLRHSTFVSALDVFFLDTFVYLLLRHSKRVRSSKFWDLRIQHVKHRNKCANEKTEHPVLDRRKHKFILKWKKDQLLLMIYERLNKGDKELLLCSKILKSYFIPSMASSALWWSRLKWS